MPTQDPKRVCPHPPAPTAPIISQEEAELATHKRKFEEFAANAHEEIDSKRRQYDVTRKYQLIGLFWPRGIGLFTQIGPALLDGLDWEKREARREAGEQVGEPYDDDDDDDSNDEHRLTHARNVNAYRAAVKQYPFLRRRLLDSIKFNSKQLVHDLGTLLHEAYSDVRRTDTSRCKSGIVNWLPHAMDINVKYLPNFNFQTRSLAANMTKKDRGVNHPLTRAFLILHTHMHLVYQQSEGEAKAKAILNDMKKNKIPIDTCCLPAFLYCMKLYNLIKIKSGLFRGPLLLCAFRAIFVGPSSAMGDKVSSKPGNAKIHHITSITPELIAYVCAQVRFALCEQASWSAKHKKFDLIKFYYYILDIITVKSQENWRKNLYRFWNQEIFDNDSSSGVLDPPDLDSDMARLYDEFDNDSDEELEGDGDGNADPDTEPDA
ncbi:hypothetical protein VKT23_005360 [Stygiomarasmius scandens]|uniref:Uncharacterized protein n=1 Tax=Marasmiellus scandens TaxID=2682957 RepID=A0ABR1JST2_9AGAR